MDFIFEFLVDLLLEGSIEISKNKKTPKYIRYPLIFIIFLLFATVTIGLIILGILIINKNIVGGLLISFSGIVLLILFIIKIKMIYNEGTNQ